MMKNLRRIIGALAILAAVSCAKTPSADKGLVIFELSTNQQVADMTKSNISDYTDLPSVSDFTITISGETFNWTGLVSEWDPTTPVLAGEYSVTASYGQLEEEGFDKPYFVGTETFTVVGGETVAVSVPVSLGNTVVKVQTSEYFKKYYTDYTFDITRDGVPVVSFAKDETRAAFVDAYKFTISGVLESETKTYTFSKDYANLDVATAYTFAFDVTNVGGGSITITFKDGYTETIELGEYELND